MYRIFQSAALVGLLLLSALPGSAAEHPEEAQLAEPAATQAVETPLEAQGAPPEGAAPEAASPPPSPPSPPSPPVSPALQAVRRPAAPRFDPLPPIVVKVRGVVYERVGQDPPQGRRRPLASRGAARVGAASGGAAGAVTRARRAMVELDLAPIIERHAARYRLDPWLVRAVIQVESGFRPEACSPAGAGGLMQLMPATAASLGCRDRFDPEANIAAGARYLRAMLDRFGSVDLALAAYNAGPGNVRRYRGIPPFAETRRYIQKVRRAWKSRGRA